MFAELVLALTVLFVNRGISFQKFIRKSLKASAIPLSILIYFVYVSLVSFR